MRVDIDTLETACHIIFDHLKEAGVESIEIEKDFYWNIAKERRYDPYEEPELDMGQLSSDWEEIQKIASGDKAPLGYALVWLASIYKFLGENNPG